MPIEPDTLIRAAARAHREGRLDEAARLARDVLAARPSDLEAMLLLGVLAAKQRQPGIAVQLLTQVTEFDPTSYNAFYWLSTALRRSGDLPKALAMAERAVALNSQEPQALHLLGMCRMEIQDWEGAAACFQSAAKLAPNVPAIQLNLGMVFEELGRNAEAALAYRRVLALNPSQIEALNRLGQALAHDLDFQGAKECADAILKVTPDSASGHWLLAIAMVGLNKPSEAAAHVERALALSTGKPALLTLSGTILESLGRLDEARQQLKRSIEIEPLQGYPYYALVRTHRVTEADSALVEQMERVACDPGLSRRHRGDLEYALGKVCADRGEFGEAMGHYDLANQIIRERRFGSTPFDAKSYAEGVDFAVRNIDAGFLDRYQSAGSQDPLPVFVVGMIRSGTTLVEQILSSHLEVGAGGELRFWPDNRGAALDPPGNVLNLDRLKTLQKDYLSLLREFGPDSSRVVDKMPGNYANLGLIHVAFPNARIIHMRRNPIDTCLSIWMTPNSALIESANDKEAIVFAYKKYLRIMEHWRSILPSDRLMEIDYEELVADTGRLSRAMVDFCGLEWDDKCLRPEENTRAVATPSNWQVRQPIYKTAVARWRSYEPWLGEFGELLSNP